MNTLNFFISCPPGFVQLFDFVCIYFSSFFFSLFCEGQCFWWKGQPLILLLKSNYLMFTADQHHTIIVSSWLNMWKCLIIFDNFLYFSAMSCKGMDLRLLDVIHKTWIFKVKCTWWIFFWWWWGVRATDRIIVCVCGNGIQYE